MRPYYHDLEEERVARLAEKHNRFPEIVEDGFDGLHGFLDEIIQETRAARENIERVAFLLEKPPESNSKNTLLYVIIGLLAYIAYKLQ